MLRANLILTLLLAVFLLAHAAPANRPPNVILILTDDQGYQDLGCYGSPNIKTPHIDRLAADGMRFTDFYAASPLCTPSRAALMTGCYPIRVGMGDFPVLPGDSSAKSSNVLYPNSPYGLNPAEFTLPRLFKSAGYSTHLVGKWHLGDAKEFLPLRHSFDTFFGLPNVNDQPPLYYMHGDDRLDTPAVDMNSVTETYTREAVDVIRAAKDRPFFLFLSHTMPHIPLGASKDFKGKSAAGPYGDAVEELDSSVGQILSVLKELGIEERTLVIFTSDNGPWLQRGLEGGNAVPFRAGKGTTYEGGMRVPCVVRWPGRVPPNSTCHAIASLIDFLPTFAAITGTPLPADRPIDGKDISPLLASPAAPTPHEYLLYYGIKNRLNAIRSGPWKLKFETTLQEETHYYGKAPNPDTPIPPKLFNLTLDPGEQKSLLKDHPDVVQRLTTMADRARAGLGDARTNKAGTCTRPVGLLTNRTSRSG